MKHLVFTLLMLVGLASSVTAQTVISDYVQYGRLQVDTLSSGTFYGRGHMEQGERRAAYHIATEFYKMNLAQFSPAPSYYQTFSVSSNLFPEVPVAIVDATPLICGRDFVPDAASGPIRNILPLVFLDSTSLKSQPDINKWMKRKLGGKALVVDAKGIKDEDLLKFIRTIIHSNPMQADCIIEIQDKLTFSVSTTSNKFAGIQVKRGLISRNSKQIKINMPTSFVPEIKSSNVTGYIWGKAVTDTFIVFTAHYDHLGMLGRYVIFPGANDNASGTAMLLTLAKYFSRPENQPNYSIAFIAFAGEEAGLLGSMHYVRNPIIPLKKIKFLVNLDILGTGDEGITVVNATKHPQEFGLLEQLNRENGWLPLVKSRGPAANSDHYPFSEAGVKSFFIYTMGGIKAYHDIYDRTETLPLNKFGDLFQLLIAFHGKLDQPAARH